MDISQFVIEILGTSKDLAIRYQCLMCIQAICKRKTMTLNYAKLFEELTPIILDMLNSLFSPKILFPLISFITTLMEKAQKTNPQYIIEAFKKSNIQLLLNKDNDLIRGAVIDMFKTLLTSFPEKTKITEIYAIVLNYIDLLMGVRNIYGYFLTLTPFLR